MPQRVVDRPLEPEEKVEEEMDCHSVLALDVPLLITGNLSFHEDEMMSWLMYPFDDALDQPHGSELFGDFTNPHLHLVKDSFINQSLKESEIKANGHDSTRIGIDAYEEAIRTCNGSKRFPPGSRSPSKQNDELKSVYIDAHGLEKANDDMKRLGPRIDGIGKGTSNAPKRHDCDSHGLERTSNDPKRLDICGSGLSTHPVSSVESSLKNKNGSAPNSLILEERRVSSHHPYEPQNDNMQYTFPLFSRPVAATRDSLRILGAESGPTNIERVRKALSKDLISSSEVSLPILFSDSNTNDQENEQLSEVKKSLQQNDIACLKSSSSDDFKDTEQSMGCISEQLELNRSSNSEHDRSSKKDKRTSKFDCPTARSEHGTRMVEIASSSSIVSGSVILNPTRFCGNEQSQDVKDVGATTKTSYPLKRIRAAETHNESEKRRRNRINIKLKALQDLIPNSTKTDKASVLDDAIQYLKLLQAQVQLMTTRSTSMYPPVMMLPGLQYVPMHGMSTTLPHMGMGDVIGAHQPLQAYHGVQILHALAPMAQPHLAYLPTAMVHMPSHSVTGMNTMPLQ